ncbi:MAG: RnfABCDGE type electron transport complex subunit D [Clostridiales bacterium]|nr:RnfABCDGE type electron transport complex subunit D [Clostridiales bacterium]
MNSRRQAPFIHTEKNTVYISAAHLLALIPVMAVAIVYYGLRALILIGFCAVLFELADELCSYVRGVHKARDLNSIVYGIVLALLLPPDTPLYIAAIGVLFASVVCRQISGGRGSAFLNPAAAGRLLIRILFASNEGALAMPGEGRTYLRSLVHGSSGFEGVSLSEFYRAELLTGRFPSFLGTSCAVMILAGLVYLLAKRICRFYLPLSYIGMLTVLLFIKDVYTGTSQTGVFLITSGVLFTGVYLLTDEETIIPFGSVSIFQGFMCSALTFLMSFKTTGIDLLVIPVLLTGVMTGVLNYIVITFRVSEEEKLRVKS